MRIAVFAASQYPVPQPKDVIYAPIVVAQAIMEGLAERGHEVTLFAPTGSSAKVSRIVTSDFPPLNNHPILSAEGTRDVEREKIFQLADQYLLAHLFAEAQDGAFDLLHIHPVDRALAFSRIAKTPTAFTLHDPIYAWRAWAFRLYRQPHHFYISISNAQRAPAPDLPYAATIHNGIDETLFTFSPDGGEAFLFAGRLLPRKGPHLAIQAARLAGAKLRIAGSPNAGPFWKQDIAPFLTDNVRYVGSLTPEALRQQYQTAKALLVPIQWEEPFGLTIIESMACGTPVIAFRRGSVPEIVVDGVTGFVVDTVEEMAEAMRKIDRIDRKACRKHVEQNFTVKRMVDEYEGVFNAIVARHRP